MYRSHLITIVASSVRRGTCKYCSRPIVWATVASRPGQPAKDLPFTAPRPFPVSGLTAETGVTFEEWPRGALHFVTCAHRPPRRRKARGNL